MGEKYNNFKRSLNRGIRKIPQYYKICVDWLFHFLTVKKIVVILLILFGVVMGVRELIPSKPYVSVDEITIPNLMSHHQDEITIINPTKKQYNNMIVKFESLDNYKLTPFSMIIEPKEHTIISTSEGGRFDTNSISKYDDDGNTMYLIVTNLKKSDGIDYIIRFINEDKAEHKIKVSIEKDKELEKQDYFSSTIYFFNSLIKKMRCGEEWADGKSRRINSCFGGLKGDYSSEERDIISINAWIYPEWKEGETNYIFDTGQEITKNRLSIYHHKNQLITNILESNGNQHSFVHEVNFKQGLNDIYFSLDAINRRYILFLNNESIMNYTFGELNFEIPDIYHYGISSDKILAIETIGNFRLDELVIFNKELNHEEIGCLYKVYDKWNDPDIEC